jgi:hypothetical protein
MWGIVRFVGRLMDRRHRRDAYIRETRSTDGQWEGSIGDGVHRVDDGDALAVTRTVEGDPPRDVEVSTDGGGCDECAETWANAAQINQIREATVHV